MNKAYRLLANIIDSNLLDNKTKMSTLELSRYYDIDTKTATELFDIVQNEINGIPLIMVNITQAELQKVIDWLDDSEDDLRKSGEDDEAEEADEMASILMKLQLSS